ncbi:MAG: hypothetical protein IH599_04410, partial [Bacteroidales bacterium]|nr:hypothetical protein [Bacteroidales bacterium]
MSNSESKRKVGQRAAYIQRYSLLAIILISLLLLACSREVTYGVLTLFFDGVPNPRDTVQAGIPADTFTRSIRSPVLLTLADTQQLAFLHLPYRNRECSRCHNLNGVGKLNKSEPQLCLDCHQGLTQSYKYLHGPVAGGYCSVCHDPHRASNTKLLRINGQGL